MADDFDPYAQWLGIQPHEHPIDHYRLLGLARFEPDTAKIANAADERMRLVRSFQTGPRGNYTQTLLNEIAAAKLRLLNPRSKAAYDESLRAAPEEDEFGLGDEDVVLPPGVESTSSAAAPPATSYSPAVPPTAPYVPIAAPGPTTPAPAAPASAPAGPVIMPSAAGPLAVRKAAGRRSRGRSSGPRIGLYACGFLIGVALIAAVVWSVGQALRPTGTDDAQRVAGTPPKQETTAAPVGKIAVQQASGSVYLTAQNAEIHGASPQLVVDEGTMVITDWTSEDDWLSWQFQVRRGGIFHLKLTYAVHEDAATGQIVIEVDDQRKPLDLRSSGGPDNYIVDEVLIGAKDPGLHTLTLRAVSKPGDQVMIFKEIEISPFRGRSTPSVQDEPEDEL